MRVQSVFPWVHGVRLDLEYATVSELRGRRIMCLVVSPS